MNRVLIVEPAKSVRKSICELIEVDGYDVLLAEDLPHYEAAIDAARERRLPIDLLIVNVDCRPANLDLDHIPFIAISDHPSIDEAVRMTHLGARDYICRPYDRNRILSAVRQAAKSIDDDDESGTKSGTRSGTKSGTKSGVDGFSGVNREPTSEAASTSNSSTERRRRRSKSRTNSEGRPMVGLSPEITKLRGLIDKVAPTDARVLILGENGTGKELVARCIHDKSRRSDAPFVEVNCAAIPSELIESELFGHEKGAFTSAVKQRRGKFEQANGGTLFLDEIGDMSLAAQAKVLRALQERKITRVGSDTDIDVDVRVLAATNKDIRVEIAEGRFREDLFHRLGVIIINVAALRDRSDDIPILVDYFLHEVCGEYHAECKEIAAGAVELLTKMRWSGNIRELRNVVERLVVLSGRRIEEEDVRTYCFVE